MPTQSCWAFDAVCDTIPDKLPQERAPGSTRSASVSNFLATCMCFGGRRGVPPVILSSPRSAGCSDDNTARAATSSGCWGGKRSNRTAKATYVASSEHSAARTHEEAGVSNHDHMQQQASANNANPTAAAAAAARAFSFGHSSPKGLHRPRPDVAAVDARGGGVALLTTECALNPVPSAACTMVATAPAQPDSTTPMHPHSSCVLRAMQSSPFIVTVLALDGSVAYQNPLSIRYFGDISSCMQKQQCPEARSSLPKSVLRSLFRLEQQEELHQALDMMEMEPHTHSWSRVMRVPSSCAATSSSHQLLDIVAALHPGLDCAPPDVPASSQLEEPPGQQALVQEQERDGASLGVEAAAAQDKGCKRSPVTTKVSWDDECVWSASSSLQHPFCHASGSVDCRTRARAGQAVAGGFATCTHGSSKEFSGSTRDVLRRLCSQKSFEGGHRRASQLLTGSDLDFSLSALSPAVRDIPDRVKSMLSFSISRSCLDARATAADSAKRPTASPVTRHLSLLISEVPKPRPSATATVQILVNSARADMRRELTCEDFLAPEPDPTTTSSAAAPSGRALSTTSLAPLRESIEFRSGSNCSQFESPASSFQHARSSSCSTVQSVSHTGDDDMDHCWHHVNIVRDVDPANGKQLLIIYQSDLTFKTTLETTLAQLAETQLGTLSQIFPRHVIEFLSAGAGQRPGQGQVQGEAVPLAATDFAQLARCHQDVSILFMDIVGFTSMSKHVAPAAVMSFLNSLFKAFDDLCLVHSVHKVETAGDCYIVSSGLMLTDKEGFLQVRRKHDPAESARRVVAFAKDMLLSSRKVLMPHDGSPVVIRIGIHTGSCVSGLVGTTLPKFGIFGDTMNTASRMESTCTPGHMQISSATHSWLTDGDQGSSSSSSSQEWSPTGGIEVKGKGLMQTFMWREA